MTGTFLFRFTPSMMEREALEAIFVQREGIARRILDLVRESALTPSKHHTLLIGPRGIGKTHLVSLIYHRVKAMEDLRDKLLVAWMREEEWGITSLLDLLMRIFRALVAEYNDASLTERVESLYSLPQDNIEHAAGALLKEYVGNRALLVLIENLDDIFQGLNDEGQKRLRAYIQENSFFTIVATAQSLFNSVSLQTSPFYGFFRIQHLQGLSLEESTQLLANIARYKSDQSLASFIKSPMGRARIRAVNHLAGGNHRVYVIFSQFLTRESLDELVEPFMRMLDDLTPYYQDRMRWLSPQQRKIVEFLLDRRSPATVKEIAQRCFMTHQTASSQLKSLREMEYVQSISVGRESYYELREPLMRLCVEVKKNRGEPIRLLIDFLRLWYLPTELEQRLDLLKPEAILEREYTLYALQAIKEDSEDPRVKACLDDFFPYYLSEDFARALGVTEELIAVRGNAVDWFYHGNCLARINRPQEALKALDKAIELNPIFELAWLIRGLIFNVLGDNDKALEAFEKTVELAGENLSGWFSRGEALSRLGRYDEALNSFDKVIEMNLNLDMAWLYKGTLLSLLGRGEEALAAYDEAIELGSNDRLVWNNKGATLSNLGRYEEALAAYDKAIELGEELPQVFFGQAFFLLMLGRWEEAYTALDEALHRFADAGKSETGPANLIINSLFNSTSDVSIWKTRIASLIELYEKHQIVSALGAGLAEAIPALNSEMVSDAAARAWRDVWQELAGNRTEFQLPLRLLDVAVRYRETKDQRVLLELPIEERKLIEPLLGVKEKTES